MSKRNWPERKCVVLSVRRPFPFLRSRRPAPPRRAQPRRAQPTPDDDEPSPPKRLPPRIKHVSPPPPPPKRRRRPVEEDEYLSDIEDDFEEEEERIPTRKRKKKGSQIAWGRVLGGGLKAVVRYTLAAIGLLVVTVITFAIAVHWPLAIVVPGLLLYVVGHLWLIIVPFEDGVLEGLLCLFLPFYVLYYLVKNFDKMKEPFIVTLVGWVILVIGFCAGGGMKPSPRGQRAIPQWQSEFLIRSEVAVSTEALPPNVG